MPYPSAGPVNALGYRLFHVADYALVRYSISHFADFARGIDALINLFQEDEAPLLVRTFLHRAKQLINKPILSQLAQREPGKKLSATDVIYYGRFLKDEFKSAAF